jgi:mono/diheme cytochrome c family protein
MLLLRLLLPISILGAYNAGWAQSPAYGVGRSPTAEEIRAWDISISPTGKELPAGQGTAKEGAQLYAQKCSACHGATGTGGAAPTLIRSKGTAVTDTPERAPQARGGGGMAGMDMGQGGGIMALRSPYATTLWDYINRGMPLNKEGTLKPDEVYAITAWLLYKNDVVQENDLLNAQSLPLVKMPNRDGAAPVPPWKHGAPLLSHYP